MGLPTLFTSEKQMKVGSQVTQKNAKTCQPISQSVWGKIHLHRSVYSYKWEDSMMLSKNVYMLSEVKDVKFD